MQQLVVLCKDDEKREGILDLLMTCGVIGVEEFSLTTRWLSRVLGRAIQANPNALGNEPVLVLVGAPDGDRVWYDPTDAQVVEAVAILTAAPISGAMLQQDEGSDENDPDRYIGLA